MDAVVYIVGHKEREKRAICNWLYNIIMKGQVFERLKIDIKKIAS